MSPTRRMTRTPCLLEVEATCLETGRTRCIPQVVTSLVIFDSVVCVDERGAFRVYPLSHVTGDATLVQVNRCTKSILRALNYKLRA